MIPLGPRDHTATRDRIDVDRIRDTYARVLGEQRIGRPVLTNEAERAELADLLRGHATLLMFEVEEQAPGMEGENRQTAEHVVARTRAALDVDVSASRADGHLCDLAFLTRALLTLHEYPNLGRSAAR